MSYNFKNIYSTFDRYIDDKFCTIVVKCKGTLYDACKGSWNPDSLNFGPDDPPDLDIHEIIFCELIMMYEDFLIEEMSKELENITIDDLSDNESEQLYKNLYEDVCIQEAILEEESY